MVAKKPGPAPNPETRKEPPTGVRLPATLRARLEAESAKNEVTLSQEIITRLQLSFDQERRRAELFGGDITYSMCRHLAYALEGIRAQTGLPWHATRFCWDHAVAAALEVLENFKPAGPRKVPEDIPVIAMLKREQPRSVPAEKRIWDKMELGKISAQIALVNLTRSTNPDANPELQALKPLFELMRRKLAAGSVKAAEGKLLKTYFRNLSLGFDRVHKK